MFVLRWHLPAIQSQIIGINNIELLSDCFSKLASVADPRDAVATLKKWQSAAGKLILACQDEKLLEHPVQTREKWADVDNI